MYDLVHDVEIVFPLSEPLTATFFDLHVQCNDNFKVHFFALWLFYVTYCMMWRLHLSCLNH